MCTISLALMLKCRVSVFNGSSASERQSPGSKNSAVAHRG